MTTAPAQEAAQDAPAALTAAWAALVVPDDKLPTIHQIMAAVKAEVGPVSKSERNAQQNFNYRGIDNVVNAIAPAFDKYGVIPIPELLEADHSTVQVGQNRTVMGYCRVRVAYHFQGPRGDEIRAVVPGEAMDFGDKAVAKAMSVAFRIALLQVLNLPTSEADPDSQTYERSPMQSAGAAFEGAIPADQYRAQQNGNARQHGNGHAPANGTGQRPQQAQRSAPSYPSQPLADDDPWKDRIGDLATGEEANLLWEEIAGEVKAGTMAQVRAGILQSHIRYHMHTRGSQDTQPAANGNGHQAADPATTGQHDPWADQPDTDPWSADAEQPATQTPRQAPAGDSDWIATFKQNVDAAPDADALNKLRRSIGQAILDKHITAQESAGLSNLVQERVRALSASGAE